jgi:hypothetical protein
MEEANQSYHRQIVWTIIAITLFEALKEIKRKIPSGGRVKLSRVPAQDIEVMAKASVMERRDEFLDRPKHRALCRMKSKGFGRRRSECDSERLNET